MFCIEPDPVFSAAISISRPGRLAPMEVEFDFTHKNSIQLTAWIASSGKKPDADLLFEVIKGWRGVIDPQGDPVEFNRTSLKKLLINFSPARAEIFKGYLKELTEAKAKN